ncbi:MAG: EAL domain-containing protein [Pseudomonadota bacterium]
MIFAASYLLNDFSNDRLQSAERATNEATSLAISAKSLHLQNRELEKEFLLSRSQETRDQLEQGFSQIIRVIEELGIELAGREAYELKSSVTVYQTAVSERLRLLDELGLSHNSGLEGKLRGAAHRVEAAFLRIDDHSLLAQLMYLRRHEKDFMLRLDEEYRQKFQHRLIDLNTALEAAPISSDLRGSIRSDLETYERSFLVWSENRLKLQSDKETTNVAFNDSVSRIENAISVLLNKAQSLQSKSERADLAATISLALALGLFSVFTIFLFRMTVRHKNMSALIHKLAYEDALTKLPNRRAFVEKLDQLLSEWDSETGSLSVGLLDLDGFKSVNDVYGHPAGDELLVQVAERLKPMLPKDASVGRLGGDEFGICLRTSGVEQAINWQHLCDELKHPFKLKDATVRIGGSCGYTTARSSDASIGNLLDRADFALYKSKLESKGDATVFSEKDDSYVTRVREIERALLNENLFDELDVVFQPIVEVGSNDTRAMEALVRWNNPVLGDVSPVEFIPIAEKAGRITDITCFVLCRSMEIAQSWPSRVLLSVNLSTADLATRSSVERIYKLLVQSPFNPRRVVFEITESALMKDHQRGNSNLQLLRELGVHVALDDFGTGYSSLSYLSQLSIDRLKIDRSFTDSIVEDQQARNLLIGIFDLCSSIGIGCVVEGIEDQAQYRLIADRHGTLAQGYLFSKPLTVADASRFLDQKNSIPLLKTA